MKTLCITGLVQRDLDFIGQVLQEAGMQQARPAASGRNHPYINLSMADWHEQVLSLPFNRYTEMLDSDHDSSQAIGRLWEQLATDIFVGNLESSVWGWADTRSADLLPFWKQFDPQICFLLVTVSKERYVAHVIESLEQDQEAVTDVATLLDRWQGVHKALLGFHRDNPANSILVDMDDCLAQPASLIKLCQKKFSLDLIITHFPNVTAPEIADIARYMATQLCLPVPEHYQYDAFGHDLKASLTPTGFERAQINAPSVHELISQYRRMKRDIEDNEKLRANEVDQDREVQTMTLDVSPSPVGEPASSAAQELQQELDQLKTEHDQLLAREKDTQEENDLLLAQLHQVQEELENYFLKYQEADQKLKDLEIRFQRSAAIVSNGSIAESLEALSVPGKQDGVTQWRVSGLELGAQYYEVVEFGTFIESGVAGLTFARDKTKGLARWPGAADQDTVEIIVVGDQTSGPKRARVLQSLSATDWQLVRALVELLSKELEQPRVLKPQDEKVLKASATAFIKLGEKLAELPPLLHFDGLRLGFAQDEADYECLTFSFEKCWLGQKFLPEFEFRFASVNGPSGVFGANPRLEFHESRAKQGLDAWFEESRDDFGAKLELRFARPAMMDKDVWHQMAETDQHLVSALIAQLPVFIDHVKGDNRFMRRSWDDWIALADEVHETLLINTQNLEPESEPEPESVSGQEGAVPVKPSATKARQQANPSKKKSSTAGTKRTKPSSNRERVNPRPMVEI